MRFILFTTYRLQLSSLLILRNLVHEIYLIDNFAHSSDLDHSSKLCLVELLLTLNIVKHMFSCFFTSSKSELLTKFCFKIIT